MVGFFYEPTGRHWGFLFIDKSWVTWSYCVGCWVWLHGPNISPAVKRAGLGWPEIWAAGEWELVGDGGGTGRQGGDGGETGRQGGGEMGRQGGDGLASHGGLGSPLLRPPRPLEGPAPCSPYHRPHLAGSIHPFPIRPLHSRCVFISPYFSPSHLIPLSSLLWGDLRPSRTP